MNSFINTFNLSELTSEFKTGKITSEVFISTLCEHIDKTEPYVKSLIPEENRRNRLIAEADKLANKYPDPANRPVLFGTTVGIKDMFRVDGFSTRAGSLLPEKLFEGKEASFVTKLKEAGALIIGKTVTTEFAFFEPGPTANPHNINHTPGGSSSGSAAAVASGCCLLASGTQTIGSITRPASYCGITGYKPSYSRIPVDGIIPFSPSLDHAGIFAPDIKKIIPAAALLCIDWNNDYLSTKNTGKLPNIGIIEGDYIKQANNEVISFFKEKINLLEKKGYKIIEANPFYDIEKINRLHKRLAAFDIAKVHINWFNEYKHLYRHKTIELIDEGYSVSPDEVAEGLEGRFNLRNRLENIMKEKNIDIWITPSTLDDAPEGLSSTGSPLMNLPWTYSGLPTISLPAGKSAKGLPLSLQIAGAYNSDELLLVNSLNIEEDLI